MSWTLEFHREAAAEAECVTGDYEAKRDGLGVRFREEWQPACSVISSDPLVWREREGGTRRVNLDGFPFWVCYLVLDERVVVLAVAHESRNSRYWLGRIP